jgi:hypothetical protein
MSNIIKGKISLGKITGAKILKKDGRTFVEITDSKLFEGKNGDIYLDFALIPAKKSNYGETHFISHDISKDQRDAGKKGNILGNATESGPKQESAPAQSKPRPKPTPPPQEDIDEDLPF